MRIATGAAVFLWICSSVQAYGQQDSTRLLLRFKLHFQSRFSFVEGKPLSFWAGSVGYAWGPYDREITLGYQWLGSRGIRQWQRIEKQQAFAEASPIYPRTDAGYFNLGYWHIVHNSRRWKAGFPLEIGLGRAHTDFYSLALDKPLLLAVPQRSLLVPIHAGGYVEWKATRWVGIGVHSGYRYNLLRSGTLRTFDGMYYRFRVVVYPAAYREGFNFLFRGKPLPSPFFDKD
ncbi:MAG: hypothetical protein KKG00_09680 [Bacteroidetes bacterium]|nr:hypothetical protein [Bacteroidota bacterium]